MAQWSHLGIVVGITVLVGCGSPPPDPSASGDTTGSAVAGPAVDQAARQGPIQTASLGSTDQRAPKPGASITDNPRAAATGTDTRAKTAASPADKQELDRQTYEERAQAAEWLRWAETAPLYGEALGGKTVTDGDELALASEDESSGQELPEEASDETAGSVPEEREGAAGEALAGEAL